MFATTRIPGVEQDSLFHLEDTKHIVVLHKSKFYKVYFHFHGKWLSSVDLEAQFDSILNDKSSPASGEDLIPTLTAANRTLWAEMRQENFSTGVNKASLDAIERAAFVVILEDTEMDYDPKDPNKLDAFAKSLLHGDGKNRWFDKSICLIVYKNGRVGFNCEHSLGDAPTIGHLFEITICYNDLNSGYDESGRCVGKVSDFLPKPIRLQWDISTKVEQIMEKELSLAQNLLNDVQIRLVVHQNFGKGVIKKLKVSPDAFVQLALQWAYYKDAGEFCLTYEASMTRLFREGRTETVRSCSNESCEFVRALEDPNISKEDKIKLFHKAVDCHQNLYRDAMTGKGIDRHLFALYVVSKYLKINSPFLEKVLKQPWKLSTSQSPHGQTSLTDFVKNSTHLTPGGGFGPVSYDGYGVCYMFAGEDTLFFHVSSRVGCPKTDSIKFGERICTALQDLRVFLEQK